MIDIAKLVYREYALLSDGTRLNITGAVTAAGWSEGEGEISKRLSLTVANTAFEGKPLSSTIVPNTIVIITADAGGGEKEPAGAEGTAFQGPAYGGIGHSGLNGILNDFVGVFPQGHGKNLLKIS